ncbi:MAG: S-adenosylmethionine:tRNA ribosyltransferase-isomerase, partial [Bacteroidota bacterium]|nr:S-adenosylmethionine:tRNA ribosyltransferase-isomerase [Bacteroidota bacterium]
MGVPRISISDYDYSLTEDKIAKYPISPRDNAKLLVYDSGEIIHSIFNELGGFLTTQDIMFVNNTKVIPARLWFKKESGAPIQIFLLKPFSPDWSIWEALVGNRRKYKEGDELSLMNANEFNLTATWHSRDLNLIQLRTDSGASIPE